MFYPQRNNLNKKLEMALVHPLMQVSGSSTFSFLMGFTVNNTIDYSKQTNFR